MRRKALLAMFAVALVVGSLMLPVSPDAVAQPIPNRAYIWLGGPQIVPGGATVWVPYTVALFGMCDECTHVTYVLFWDTENNLDPRSFSSSRPIQPPGSQGVWQISNCPPGYTIEIIDIVMCSECGCFALARKIIKVKA